jgi:hypothetical protein
MNVERAAYKLVDVAMNPDLTDFLPMAYCNANGLLQLRALLSIPKDRK